jgi:hypothetical protein
MVGHEHTVVKAKQGSSRAQPDLLKDSRRGS